MGLPLPEKQIPQIQGVRSLPGKPWSLQPAPPCSTLEADGEQGRTGSSGKLELQWRLGKAKKLGRQSASVSVVRGMALGLQLRSWLWAILCLLSVGATSRWPTGEPMDSAGVGGVPLEPEHLDMMFEFLWTGLELDTIGQFHLRDEELASTRPGRRLIFFLQHWVPSTLAHTEQQLRQWRQEAPLSPTNFQQLLLTSLACVYRLHAAPEGEERALWAELFFLLGQEILQDLCKDHCPQGQIPLLSPWTSPNDPYPQHSSP
ncbi:protein FAM180B [Macrotis lagotis]|uniref:protein FAM180B n=1 Tax=Macrotis lagotis TaxID=92651 RepID=UPI003D68C3CD